MESWNFHDAPLQQQKAHHSDFLLGVSGIDELAIKNSAPWRMYKMRHKVLRLPPKDIPRTWRHLTGRYFGVSKFPRWQAPACNLMGHQRHIVTSWRCAWVWVHSCLSRAPCPTYLMLHHRLTGVIRCKCPYSPIKRRSSAVWLAISFKSNKFGWSSNDKTSTLLADLQLISYR